MLYPVYYYVNNIGVCRNENNSPLKNVNLFYTQGDTMSNNNGLVDFVSTLDFVKDLDTKETAECFRNVISAIYDSAKKSTRLEPRLITIIRDLEDIRSNSLSQYKIVYLSITSYPASYLDIARKLGITKQAVHKVIIAMSKQYDWIDTLLKMRSQYQLAKGHCPISGKSIDPQRRDRATGIKRNAI